jgi:hypothetical protein
MNIYWFIAIFSAWYIFSLVVSEKLGKYRHIGEEWSFFISMVLSPVIGLVVALLSKPR